MLRNSRSWRRLSPLTHGATILLYGFLGHFRPLLRCKTLGGACLTCLEAAKPARGNGSRLLGFLICGLLGDAF
jgi:hypothetical protein